MDGLDVLVFEVVEVGCFECLEVCGEVVLWCGWWFYIFLMRFVVVYVM